MSVRNTPNIILTGTPGCGKTQTSSLLAKELPGYTHYNISAFAEENKCYDGYDEARKSHLVDEDKLLDIMEPLLRKGGCIIDWHVNDIFPERLIDLVVVLRCDTTTLYDRLKARGYHSAKVDENMDAEIMAVVLQDAQEAYDPAIVIELQSCDNEDSEQNIQRIMAWANQWIKDHPEGISNEYEQQSDCESDSE